MPVKQLSPAPPTDHAIETLVAVCAQAVGHPALYTRLREAVSRVQRWDWLAERAEAHGLTPLVYTHLQAADVALPLSVQDELRGYYLQHAHASRVRTTVLTDILTAFQARAIEVLLLKGAALAYLVYPQPALRPMRDIDLLVPAETALRAQAVLQELGFTAAATSLPVDHHHLPACERVVDGQLVSVEVHSALDPGYLTGAPSTHADLAPAAHPFTLDGRPAATLSREDMLGHIYRHTFLIHWRYEWPRLVGVADLVSLVEAWGNQLDWDRLRSRYPAAYRSLPVLNQFTPWSDKTRQRLGIVSPPGQDDIGEALIHWPLSPVGAHEGLTAPHVVWARLFPPPLWLRLTHGYGPSRLDLWRARLAHLRWLGSRAMRRSRTRWEARRK